MSYNDNEMCNNCDKLELNEYPLRALITEIDNWFKDLKEEDIEVMEEIIREWREKHGL